MSASGAETSVRSTPGTVAPSRTELLLKGEPVSKERVAAWFLLGSLAVAALGVGMNWYLTGGTWVIEEGIQNRGAVTTGDGEAYLTGAPYDVITAGILVVSLVLLGGGFLAAMITSKTALRIGQGLLVLTGALWLATYYGYFADYVLAWLALGVSAPFILRTFLRGTWRAHAARGAGFVVFGLYWATQAMRLYTAEGGDFVNMSFAILAVPFFNYFAYHEALSAQGRESPRALVWLSGTAFITTGVYFVTHKVQAVSEWLIMRVSEQTEWMLLLFGQGVVRMGGDPTGSRIYYPQGGIETGAGYFAVQIILACTAIQSIMIFVGGILALKKPSPGEGVSGKQGVFNRLYHTYNNRRMWAFALTIPLIYVLNLLRNTIIIWMSGQDRAVMFSQDGWATTFVCKWFTDCYAGDTVDNYAAFWFSHNIIGKGGSLLALIVIAFIVFRILPELYDSIIGLVDLRRRRGPLERWFGERFGRRGNGRRPASSPGVKDPAAPTAAAPRDTG